MAASQRVPLTPASEHPGLLVSRLSTVVLCSWMFQSTGLSRLPTHPGPSLMRLPGEPPVQAVCAASCCPVLLWFASCCAHFLHTQPITRPREGLQLLVLCLTRTPSIHACVLGTSLSELVDCPLWPRLGMSIPPAAALWGCYRSDFPPVPFLSFSRMDAQPCLHSLQDHGAFQCPAGMDFWAPLPLTSPPSQSS